MSFLVQSTVAPLPESATIKIVSVTLAAIFIILAVGQLYSFEEFPDVIASLWLPGGREAAQTYAAMLVVLEVSAVPFLLFMRLSPAMRVASMIAGWLTIIVWMFLSLWANTTLNAVTNSGILGATIPIAPGWWMIGLFLLLGVVSGWLAVTMSLLRLHRKK